MAERVGFEPTVGCPTHAFQACALSRSAISPGLLLYRSSAAVRSTAGRSPSLSWGRLRAGRTNRAELAEREGFEPSIGFPIHP